MFPYKNSYVSDENINVFLTDIYLQYILFFQKKTTLFTINLGYSRSIDMQKYNIPNYFWVILHTEKWQDS